MKWNRAQAELVIAWALYAAGVIGFEEACAAWDRAEEMPVFRCQDLRNWPFAKYGWRCKCGEPTGQELPPCAKCAAEKNQIYHNHKRRVYLHN